MTANVLIIGATSGIAEAVARLYAGAGGRLYLVARSTDKLNVVATDLLARGAAQVDTAVWDALDSAGLPRVLDDAWASLGRVDVVLLAHGTLPDQARCETDTAYAVVQLRTNAESVIVCLGELARRLEAQKHGSLAVIGSVAGDRGRASNYLYGAAKAAVATFASGLHVRLARSGVQVLTIKPGFVSTPMTQGLPLPARLVASPSKVAADIVRAIAKGRGVLYTPWFWRYIMLVITHLPPIIFRRMRF